MSAVVDPTAASDSLPLNLPTTTISTALNISCKIPDNINGSAKEINLSIIVPLHISISYLFLFLSKIFIPRYELSFSFVRCPRNWTESGQPHTFPLYSILLKTGIDFFKKETVQKPRCDFGVFDSSKSHLAFSKFSINFSICMLTYLCLRCSILLSYT